MYTGGWHWSRLAQLGYLPCARFVHKNTRQASCHPHDAAPELKRQPPALCPPACHCLRKGGREGGGRGRPRFCGRQPETFSKDTPMKRNILKKMLQKVPGPPNRLEDGCVCGGGGGGQGVCSVTDRENDCVVRACNCECALTCGCDCDCGCGCSCGCDCDCDHGCSYGCRCSCGYSCGCGCRCAMAVTVAVAVSAAAAVAVAAVAVAQ